ncbi:class I SAM-dependent methyltransferase [Rugosimonospora africana]|uniref:Methyltransferase n=1 Tax=Rugosimonospora africana TaxID=556532 RepID=A0A8J3QJJ8_9ACTN|nr:class I SAM-dependent methyltransferase [Rugosimonospora africana]GIH12168.1 methyltransferase [Rugosimonospora africana]
MTPELLVQFSTPAGVAALDAAAELADAPPLTAASALRARGLPPDLAAAAHTQAVLRLRARAKFGPDAAVMFFTRPGLEQATRSAVAGRRALRLAEAGVTRLADLGCGVGADTLAAARAGISVHAVDADPLTAAVAAANVRALGLDDLVTVACADASAVDLSTVDGVFCDPARRRGGSRVFDPRAYSPSWDFVAGLRDRVPRTVLKLAPGIAHTLIPAGAEAEWVSVDGDLVEAAFWCGPLAVVPRRASLLGPDTQTLTGTGEREAPVGPVRRYVYDPDPAVVRAHLVAEFASTVDGTLADSRIAYVYGDSAVPTGFARCFEVEEAMPLSVKRLKAVLRERGVGRLTIKKRGSALDPDELRRKLRLDGPAEATIILTRVDDAPTVLFATPVIRSRA